MISHQISYLGTSLAHFLRPTEHLIMILIWLFQIMRGLNKNDGFLSGKCLFDRLLVLWNLVFGLNIIYVISTFSETDYITYIGLIILYISVYSSMLHFMMVKHWKKRTIVFFLLSRTWTFLCYHHETFCQFSSNGNYKIQPNLGFLLP